MTDILRLFLIIILLTIGLAAYFLVVGALFTNRVARTQHAINQMPRRSFWVGLVNFLFFGVIALILFSIAENVGNFIRVILIIPALVITAVLAITLSFGFAGLVNVLGERIFSDHSPWKKRLWGTVLLMFACALPAVGWFLLLPYTGLTGFGAVILGFFQRDEPPNL